MMEKHPFVVLCISWADDYRFGLYHQYQPKMVWTFKDLISGFNITCTSTFMIRKDFYDEIGGMDISLDDSHEYDLAIRASMRFPIACVQKSLVRFNDSNNNDNWSYDFNKKIRGMFQFVKKWGTYFDKKRWFNTIMCFVLFTIGLVNSKPINKIFTLTKMKMERIEKLKNPNIFKRFKA